MNHHLPDGSHPLVTCYFHDIKSSTLSAQSLTGLSSIIDPIQINCSSNLSARDLTCGLLVVTENTTADISLKVDSVEKILKKYNHLPDYSVIKLSVINTSKFKLTIIPSKLLDCHLSLPHILPETQRELFFMIHPSDKSVKLYA
jgi:hypothetical protein